VEPEGERAALSFDVEMGREYAEWIKSKGWEHFAGELCWLRDLMVQRLVGQKGDQEEARATIKLAEQLLLIPVAMIDRGRESEKDLKRMAAERNE
jgi:hypothetical protein